METTKWYPSYVKPFRPGVYQLLYKGNVIYAYWLKGHWIYGVYEVDNIGWYFKFESRLPYKEYSWRGLTSFVGN